MLRSMKTADNWKSLGTIAARIAWQLVARREQIQGAHAALPTEEKALPPRGADGREYPAQTGGDAGTATGWLGVKGGGPTRGGNVTSGPPGKTVAGSCTELPTQIQIAKAASVPRYGCRSVGEPAIAPAHVGSPFVSGASNFASTASAAVFSAGSTSTQNGARAQACIAVVWSRFPKTFPIIGSE